jgi:iron complex transport system substrate-binding protein
VALISCIFVLLGGFGYEAWKAAADPEVESKSEQPAEVRVVSLSPGVTDTIVALGKRDLLVGISDYCVLTPPTPPRVGSALTPNYESIARALPTRIITSDVKGEQLAPLEKLAPTDSLPWLTLAEWTDSILRVGRLVGAEQAARELSSEIDEKLSKTPGPRAPRILLALDYGESGTNDVWFIKKNSIHGALLEAAGAKNAIDRPISGPPKLSPEKLLEVDPDGIIVLLPNHQRGEERRSLDHFRKWKPLRAVREGRLEVLVAPDALTVGPRILELVAPLRSLVSQLAARESSGDTPGGEP